MKLRSTSCIAILLSFAFPCASARAFMSQTPQTQIDAVSLNPVSIVIAEPPDETSPGEAVCNAEDAKFEIGDAPRIESKQLHDKAKSLLRPAYPAIARARHIEGQVIVELLVSKTGEVVCARTLNGDPLLRETTLKVATKWRFAPFETSGEGSNVVSTLAVNFKLQ